MNRTRISSLLVLSLRFIASPLAYAQPDAASDTSGQRLDALVLAMEIVQSAEQMSAPFHVLVTIHNPTDKEWTIDSLLIELPPAVTETRDYESAATCLQRALGPQSTVKCLKRVPQGGINSFGSFIRHTLFFLPGTYPVASILVYRESVPEKPSRVELAQTTVVLHPPLASLLGGGMIGAALVAVFLTIHRMRRSKQYSRKSVAMDIGRCILLIGFGSIVAIIAILLFQQTHDIGLPLALEVTDYRGGIVIGLFSLYLGEFFYQRFREPTPQDDASDEAESPNGDIVETEPT